MQHSIKPVTQEATRSGREDVCLQNSQFILTVIDALSTQICVLDRTATIVLVNRTWRDFCAKNFPDNVNYLCGGSYLTTCVAGIDAGEIVSMTEAIHLVADGELPLCTLERHFVLHAVPLWFNICVTGLGGDSASVVVAHEDITARKHAEFSLHNALEKARYIELAINQHVIVTITDWKGVITYVNEECCSVSKYSAGELLGQNYNLLNSEYHPDSHFRDMWDTISQGHIWKGAIKNRAKDGGLYWVDTTVVPCLDAGGAPYQYIAIQTDITERKKVEEALVTSSRELRALAIHLEEIKENERKRIAREIHDDLGQHLLVLKNDISMLHARTARAHPILNSKVSLALEHIDGTMQSVRSIINNLRPATLDLGLCAAIQWQVQEFGRRTGIACELVMSDENIELDDDRTITLFRFLQEALVNASRHAQASRVCITLYREEFSISIEVSDNGQGFNSGDHRKRGSFGLMGMRERLSALGGELSIECDAGRGTRLTASVPV
jgi:PAS domain S-box-containing protein